MTRSVYLLSLLFSFVCLGISNAQSISFRQGELLLWLKKDISCKAFISKQLRSRSKIGVDIKDTLINKDWNIQLLKFNFSEVSEDELLTAFRNQPEVLMVQKNHLLQSRRTPNDTYFSKQWQHLNDGSNGGVVGADFRTNFAWDFSTGGITEDGDTIVVCVIDAGLEFTHGDLKSNIWYNRGEIPGNRIDDDKNGYIDDFKGWNSYNDNDSIISNNHGTEVCGIIGAIGNNRIGVCGVNWVIKMMIVQGGGDEASAIISYSYPWKLRKEYNLSGGKKGAFVVATNSSWGRDFGRPEEAPIWCAMYDSLGSVGILNAGSTANLDIDVDLMGDLPTNCESDFLIGVTNLNWNDRKENRAGYGVKSIDIGAYGESIFTTTTGNTFTLSFGTSAASPQIAGAIGLIYSIPCNKLSKLAKSKPSEAALFVKELILQQSRKLKSLANLTKTEAVLNLQDIVYAIQPVEANSDLNQISFKSLQSLVIPITLQYRKLGASEWIEIQLNNTDEYIVKNLSICTPYEYRVKGGCDRYQTEYSKIQLVSTKGCCVAPEKIEIIEIGMDNIILTFKDLKLNSNFIYTLTEIGMNKADTFEVLNITDPLIAIHGLNRCSRYELKLFNYCDKLLSPPSSKISFKTSGCDQCDDIDYCKRDRPSSELEWLESLSIDNDLFVSGNNLGYGDFIGTSHTWDLSKSSTHTIRLTPGFSLDSSFVYLTAWIDYNHNSIFENSENLLPFEYKTKVESNFTFMVPSNARNGITRMRIIAKYGENGVAAPVSCFSGIEFGEYEEYCVRIMDQICSPINSVFEVTKSISSVSFNISKANSTDIISYKYRKIPYGLWKEGRVFDNSLTLAKLDSCSSFEMILKNECDFVNSEGLIVGFNTITSSCFVGSDNATAKNLLIYPNPFTDWVIVQTDLGDLSSVSLFDLNGHRIYNSPMVKESNLVNLQLKDFVSGVYFLELKFVNGRKIVKKISKI